MQHPDHLKLSARQLYEWYVFYCEEPFGELRDDLRQVAGLGLQIGVNELNPVWPYWEDPPTADDLKNTMAELESLIDGNRG